jgi:signal transduction histidine kinase
MAKIMDSRDRELIQGFDTLKLPIGVYFVAPDGQFIECNRVLRQMLMFPLEGDVTARSTDFYVDPSQRPLLLERAVEAEQKSQLPQKEIIELRVNGHHLFVEDHCKPLRHPDSNEIVGYVGCLIDVTTDIATQRREKELKRKVDELTHDIGQVLHTYNNTLVMVQQTLNSVAEAIDPVLAGELHGLFSVEVYEPLNEQVIRLVTVLNRLLDAGDLDRRLRALSGSRWNELAAKNHLLRNINKEIPLPVLRPPALRTISHEITTISKQIEGGSLSRELVRSVLVESRRLERLCALIDVLETRTAIVLVEHALQTLRNYISTDIRTSETHSLLPVVPLLEQAVALLAEFAKDSRVEIVLRDQSQSSNALVSGDERDLVRTIYNLLHNAIKYTWRRDRSKLPWVNVRVYTQSDFVHLDFENWGVPISRREVEEGRVFQLGYRGEWATDRGRLGTGIGLTDAKRVAETHGGDIKVESRPASHTTLNPEDPDYYRQPFLTKVSLCLPLVRK